LPVGDKRAQRWRSYSIASSPLKGNQIELCIVENPKGLGTPYLFSLNVGDEIRFKGPDGGFVLPTDSSKKMVLICTGTGIAPFRSMINYDLEHNKDREIHLIFGCRKESDILFLDEWILLSNAYPNFKFDIACSREVSTMYHHGYVHDIYMSKYAGVSLEDHIFMVCGWSGMIDQACDYLINRLKVPLGSIKYELYG
jgi:CDP-4-dehydro-6-deoxyglucose reductase